MRMRKMVMLPLVLTVAFFAAFFLNCRVEVIDVTGTADFDVTEESSSLLLKGMVVDKKTQTGISNATVVIDAKYEVTTDNNGNYTLGANLIGGGTCEIWAYAEGYGYGSTLTDIDPDKRSTVVNTIQLLPLNSPDSIGVNGGTIRKKTLEGLSIDSVVVSIPDSALDQATNISVTPFEGVDVPGLPPFGYLNIATVHIAPVGKPLNKNATVTFPLPLTANYLGDSVPLLYFNKQTYRWMSTGKYATVNVNDNTATAEISVLNTYSLEVKGSYEEALDSSYVFEESTWKIRTSSEIKSWQATVEYPEGIPNESTFSPRWLRNAVSQNTRLVNGRTSFFDPTYTVLNFSGDCFIKITIIIIIIPEYLTVNGIQIYNVVKKYDYIIDQNCLTGGSSN